MKTHDFSPDELERHVQHCGNLMVAAYGRYEASGCLSDRGEADGFRLAMERAIAARGPAVVAAMEAERGISARVGHASAPVQI